MQSEHLPSVEYLLNSDQLDQLSKLRDDYKSVVEFKDDLPSENLKLFIKFVLSFDRPSDLMDAILQDANFISRKLNKIDYAYGLIKQHNLKDFSYVRDGVRNSVFKYFDIPLSDRPNIKGLSGIIDYFYSSKLDELYDNSFETHELYIKYCFRNILYSDICRIANTEGHEQQKMATIVLENADLPEYVYQMYLGFGSFQSCSYDSFEDLKYDALIYMTAAHSTMRLINERLDPQECESVIDFIYVFL